jgi:hypothetical protein
MKKRHILSVIEQDALLVRINVIASRKAGRVLRSPYREDIVQDVLLSCLEALRAGTFVADLDALDGFITNALQRRAAELREQRKDEQEARAEYRREVMFTLHAENSKRLRKAMRRKVNLWRPEEARASKQAPSTIVSGRPTSEVIRRSHMLGRRIAENAKEQTKWRVRRRKRDDRAPEGIDGQT